MKKNKTGFFNQVYTLVQKIPPGKVSTYGQVANSLGTKDARCVGWALHSNPSELTPCHRVVNKDGRLAPNFAWGSSMEQKRRLLAEGVVFKDNFHVDLNESGLKQL